MTKQRAIDRAVVKITTVAESVDIPPVQRGILAAALRDLIDASSPEPGERQITDKQLSPDRKSCVCPSCGVRLQMPPQCECKTTNDIHVIGCPAQNRLAEPTVACAHCDGYRSKEGRFFHNPTCKDFVPFHLLAPPQRHEPTPGAIDRPGFLPAEPEAQHQQCTCIHSGGDNRDCAIHGEALRRALNRDGVG